MKSVWLLVLILVVGGCATPSEDTLELENILREKKTRQERLAGQVSETAPQDSQAPAPSELEVLMLPRGYRKLEAGEVETLKKNSAVPPFAEAVWQSAEMGLTVSAGKAPMDRDAVLAMTRDEFLAKMKDIDKVYDAYYGDKHQSQSTLDLRENGKLICVTVLSKFVKDGAWQAEKRVFYLYTPDYRLSVLITGTDEAMTRGAGALDSSLRDFEELLRQAYPEGINFKSNV
ncbi:MAG TPA: hypothetical protein VL688_09710 [Verrucomicrobiae bacterium]|nr:hypothetical protein [Verrucomicrobiae bacterium]